MKDLLEAKLKTIIAIWVILSTLIVISILLFPDIGDKAFVVWFLIDIVLLIAGYVSVR